jgi:chromate transporter
MAGIDDNQTKRAPPTLGQLAASIARIGATSIGGGLTSWMMREFVQERRWLSSEEFLSGLAVAQALPGVNVVNLSIWIGWRLHGAVGAAAAAAAIILPGLVLIGALAAGFSLLGALPATHRFLAGAVAVAIGLSLAMGVQAARPVVRRAVPAGLMVLCFILAGPLRLPALPIIVGLGVAGIGWQFWIQRAKAGRHA